ncbi:hypothetical protein Pcinc_024116 [Petrolisthes cinctipes]|uniref:Uncharacterized protein n=1 Tax=Petrolisthes cinctipes TaxID=88211 RepID=A0AAE1FBP9_PETCI|nr:hypothetical protein Pcinc_024116 [Petrolisthes cinctipes]
MQINSSSSKPFDIHSMGKQGCILAPTLFRQRRLRWHHHIPKDILYGKLASGVRNTGRSQLRYKDDSKKKMNVLNIETGSWESLAANHTRWSSALN